MTERLVRILETFTPTRTVQSATEIGRRAGLPSSSAHRIIAELIDVGILERDDGRRIRIGLRLWELATRSSHALRLQQAALPFMERIQAKVREHTQLAIREHDEALFLERLSDPGAGTNVMRTAGRLPLHASASGLVLLAFADSTVTQRIVSRPLRRFTTVTPSTPEEVRHELATVRQSGHAIAKGYVDAESTGLAVPVRDETNSVVAALSVVLPLEAETSFALVELYRGAREIERAIGRRQSQ